MSYAKRISNILQLPAYKKGMPVPAANGKAVTIAEEADQEIARLREALAPFAEIADHFPKRREFGNRPWEGLIYSWHTSGFPDAELTVEHVHAARAALAQVAEVGNG